jgi:hypothetical protein
MLSNGVKRFSRGETWLHYTQGAMNGECNAVLEPRLLTMICSAYKRFLTSRCLLDGELGTGDGRGGILLTLVYNVRFRQQATTATTGCCTVTRTDSIIALLAPPKRSFEIVQLSVALSPLLVRVARAQRVHPQRRSGGKISLPILATKSMSSNLPGIRIDSNMNQGIPGKDQPASGDVSRTPFRDIQQAPFSASPTFEEDPPIL